MEFRLRDAHHTREELAALEPSQQLKDNERHTHVASLAHDSETKFQFCVLT